jgi:YkoY family integral membrane protein
LTGFILLNQNIEASDLVVVGLLILLEGLLSIDNALVLGLLAKRLPKEQRSRALAFGLFGAFLFRSIAILSAAFLMQWRIVKLFGGLYLLYIALKHLLISSGETQDSQVVIDAEGEVGLVDPYTRGELTPSEVDQEIHERVPIGASMVTGDRGSSESSIENLYVAAGTKPIKNGIDWKFWKTVLVIELTDIAFAVDSILAALALAGTRKEKMWVVLLGGLIGLVLMRFAAAVFVRLLDRFPRFEVSAYLLVIVIGLKLVIDWGTNNDLRFASVPWPTSVAQRLEKIEAARVSSASSYDQWLDQSWPLGRAAPHAPPPGIEPTIHLLDFHDLRRPESITFWAMMLCSLGYGFLPRRGKKNVATA